MSIMKDIKGIQVLLPTPMSADGTLDYESTGRLIEHVIEAGVHGIILLGSTGEFFSLSERERTWRFRFTLQATTTELARHSEQHGADYLLVPIPFYFANTMRGVVDFFTRVAQSVSIPVMPC